MTGHRTVDVEAADSGASVERMQPIPARSGRLVRFGR